MASLAEAVPSLDLRIANSEAGRPWMEALRTPDGRAATPTILLLDEAYEIRGCWIEMPASVWEFWQPALERDEAAQIVDRKMAWYLQHLGWETLTDLLEILEAAQRGDVICPGL
ncbi:MAG: thioredoxin family protein [Gemmatimonadota bacterium]